MMHVAESRAWFDEYNYRDSLQARAIEGIGHSFDIRDISAPNYFLYTWSGQYGMPTKHGVCDYHCKNWSSKASPVSSQKTHKRLDPVSKELIIKCKVKLMIVQNLQQGNEININEHEQRYVEQFLKGGSLKKKKFSCCLCHVDEHESTCI